MTDSFKLLDTVEPGALPVINDLVFTNAANRIAGVAVGSVTLEDRHVGKIALQEDNNSLWRCLQVNPTLKWARISGRDVSEADFEWVIDPINGNDATGDGTVTYPFKSFACLDDLPLDGISHTYRIKPKAGTYTYFPKELVINTVGEGRVIIDASAEAYVEDAIGELTLTSAAGIGNPAGFGVSTATKLTVSGASWTNDQFYGKYVWTTGGNWTNYILDIHSNTNDDIVVGADWYGFAGGDTFKIVTEPVVIDVDHPILFRGSSKLHLFISGTSMDSPLRPAFFMAGLRFKSAAKNPFRFENLSMTHSFCTFWGESTDATSKNMLSINCDHNFNEIPSDIFDVTELEDYFAFGNLSIPLNGTPPTTNITCWEVQNTDISQLGCRGAIRWEGESGKSSAFGIKAAKTESLGQFFNALEYFYLEQIGWDTPAIVVDRSNVSVVSLYSQHNEGFVSCSSDGSASLLWLQGADPLAGSYAADLRYGSKIYILSNANATPSGAAGAIKFQRVGAATSTRANWPTNGNAFDDRDASGEGATCFVVADNL